jgi:LPS export ABC transporter protein LptC
MNWRWISIAALLAALVAGYGAFMQRDSTQILPTEAAQSPSYFLQDAIITQTDEDGLPSLRLIAARITQPRTGETIKLANVHVDFLQTKERQWVLTAQEGFVPEASRIIEFKGDVHLRPADSTTPTYLRTNALTFDTEKNIAYTTTSPVNLRFGKLGMTVKRFEADLNTEKVKLESIRGQSEKVR